MVKLCSPFRACHSVFLQLIFKRKKAVMGLFNKSSNLDIWDEWNCITGSNDSLLHSSAKNDIWPGVGQDESSNIFWLEYLSVCVFTNLVAVSGLVGNIFNIIILSRVGMGRDTTTMLLLALAVTDIAVLVTNLAQFSSCFVCYLEKLQYYWVDTHLYLYPSFPAVGFGLLSVDITAVIALERAVAVHYPFRVGAVFTPNTVKILLVGLLFLTLPILWPPLVALDVVSVFDQYSNKTIDYTIENWMYWPTFYSFMTWLENIHLFGGMSVVFICGLMTTLKLIHQSDRRKLMTSNTSSLAASAQDRKAVKMLLLVCLFSFLGNIPNITGNLVTNYHRNYLIKTGWYCFSRGIPLIFIVFSSSVNFFIYFFMSSKFQKAYRELLGSITSFGCFFCQKNGK